MDIKILSENPTEEERDEATRQMQQWFIEHGFAREVLTVEPPPPPPPPTE
jgi:hypothetical protein